MADIDDPPWSGRNHVHELPYDRERRERHRGRAPAIVVGLLILGLMAFAYWLRHA